jgi:hypothetical protein
MPVSLHILKLSTHAIISLYVTPYNLVDIYESGSSRLRYYNDPEDGDKTFSPEHVSYCQITPCDTAEDDVICYQRTRSN